MTTSAHTLLISEDQGNTAALKYAEQELQKQGHVTWICSAPNSSGFAQLEAASALKNTYMSALNLLVITRNEKQPFEVLTGKLDQNRINRCAELLFNSDNVTQIAVAGSSERRLELAQFASGAVASVNSAGVKLLDAESKADSNADTAPIKPTKPTSAVAVTVIMQGRELTFEMDRSAGTLLDGAEDAGIDLPFSCRGGVCSTCRARLRTGEVELMENYALEEWELDAGFTLPCQAEPVSLEITLDYDEV